LLVFANKQDIQGALKPAEIAKVSKLQSFICIRDMFSYIPMVIYCVKSLLTCTALSRSSCLTRFYLLRVRAKGYAKWNVVSSVMLNYVCSEASNFSVYWDSCIHLYCVDILHFVFL